MPDTVAENGVVCRHCFKTVNLSTLPKSSLKKSRFPFGPDPAHFKMVCPHCGKKASYPYYQIQPMTAWMTSFMELETKLRIAEAERDKARADAVMLAEQAHRNLPSVETEGAEQSSVPSNSRDPKEPQPAEKKKDGLPYLA